MNGGGFFINELGFWLDGYDKEKMLELNIMKRVTNIQ